MKHIWLISTVALLGSTTAFGNGSSPQAVDYSARPSSAYSAPSGSAGFQEEAEDDSSSRAPASTRRRSRRSSGPSASDPENCPYGMTGRNGRSSSRRLAQDMGDIAAYSRGGGITDNDMDPNMIRVAEYARSHARLTRGRGGCVVSVRQALMRMGAVKDYPRGNGNAWAKLLGQRCFSNAIGRYPTPESAPDGAVLVYDGVRRGGDKWWYAGHVEFKIHNEYVSDYHSPRPAPAVAPSGRTAV